MLVGVFSMIHTISRSQWEVVQVRDFWQEDGDKGRAQDRGLGPCGAFQCSLDVKWFRQIEKKSFLKSSVHARKVRSWLQGHRNFSAAFVTWTEHEGKHSLPPGVCMQGSMGDVEAGAAGRERKGVGQVPSKAGRTRRLPFKHVGAY